MIPDLFVGYVSQTPVGLMFGSVILSGTGLPANWEQIEQLRAHLEGTCGLTKVTVLSVSLLGGAS